MVEGPRPSKVEAPALPNPKEDCGMTRKGKIFFFALESMAFSGTEAVSVIGLLLTAGAPAGIRSRNKGAFVTTRETPCR